MIGIAVIIGSFYKIGENGHSKDIHIACLHSVGNKVNVFESPKDVGAIVFGRIGDCVVMVDSDSSSLGVNGCVEKLSGKNEGDK
jgi:hypothetical protein